MHPTSDPAMRTVTSSATPSCNKASEAHGVSQGRTESTSTDAHQGVGRGNSCNLLASIPLLYGLSKQIIPQPGYWPSSVHCCGFWQQKHTGTECDRKQQLHALLKPVLPHNSLEEWRSGQPLVCIDFGSMGCMGLIADPHHLVAVLVAALHIAGAKGILLTGGWRPLLQAADTAAQPAVGGSVLIAAPRSIPHSLLLPDCSAVLHHGGAGTCAAALTAGLPHLVCPFHFDQFSWAERLTYLGVATQGSTQALVGAHTPSSGPLVNPTGPPSPPSLLYSGPDPSDNNPSNEPQPPTMLPAAQKLADQMKVLLSGRLNQQCQNIQAGLQGEDGISNAVDILIEQLQSAAVPRRSTMPPLQLPAANRQSQPEASDKLLICPPLEAAPCKASRKGVDDQALVVLPNGWQVPACAEAEALFIYNEIVEQQCYLQEGLFTWWVLKGGPNRGQASRVLAVEPMPQNIAVMQANLERHGLSSQVVKTVPQAVGQAEGEAVFRYYPAMPGNSTCHVPEKQQLQHQHMAAHFFTNAEDCVCPVTTISHLMERHDLQEINLLKIDVEGCELEALQGIQLHHWSHISQIVLEVHDTAGRLHEITAMLEAQRYLVVCQQGLAPTTHMVFARRHL
ncbi:hypothetical protein ABBQ38_002826 [Trebouxia sp. C0009 RCD-2024]